MGGIEVRIFAVNETIAIKKSTCSEEEMPSDTSCKEGRVGKVSTST